MDSKIPLYFQAVRDQIVLIGSIPSNCGHGFQPWSCDGLLSHPICIGTVCTFTSDTHPTPSIVCGFQHPPPHIVYGFQNPFICSIKLWSWVPTLVLWWPFEPSYLYWDGMHIHIWHTSNPINSLWIPPPPPTHTQSMGSKIPLSFQAGGGGSNVFFFTTLLNVSIFLWVSMWQMCVMSLTES